MTKRTIKIIPAILIVLTIFFILSIRSYAAEISHPTILAGVNYSAVYNYDYYIAHNSDVQNTYNGNDVKTLEHFVKYGMAEGRQANATFDVSSYKNAYADLREAYGYDLKSYYLHYINYGKSEGRTATGVTNIIGAVTKAGGVNYSSVYDYAYYIAHNPDVKQAYGNDDIAALNHFVKYGMAEGRQAISTFDVHSYRLANPDVRNAYRNDLKSYYLHYINYGKAEGRTATGVTKLIGAVTTADGVNYSPIYDYAYYIAHNPDVKRAYGDDDIATLNQFVKYGMAEGRQANATFDVSSYKNEYADLRESYGKDLKSYYLHYINYGKAEGRIAIGVTTLVGTTKVNGTDYSAVYDYQYYIAHNSDVEQAFGDDDIAALNQFVKYGMAEGRQASTDFNVLLYKGNYWDLQAAFGSNLKFYYQHYLSYGKLEGRTGTIQIHNYIRAVTTGGLVYTCSICGDTHTVPGPALGIDVSSHQRIINWDAVKASGVQFAIIRCGFGDNMTSQDDAYFQRNVQECERLGISWGTYLYSYAKNITGSDASAESEYQHMVRLLQGKHPTLPVYIDMEEETGGDYVAIANYICSKLKSSGYNSGVYANLYWWDNILNDSCFNNYERWVAQYYKECQYDGSYHVWQYASDGIIPGISGNVDMDILII